MAIKIPAVQGTPIPRGSGPVCVYTRLFFIPSQASYTNDRSFPSRTPCRRKFSLLTRTDDCPSPLPFIYSYLLRSPDFLELVSGLFSLSLSRKKKESQGIFSNFNLDISKGLSNWIFPRLFDVSFFTFDSIQFSKRGVENRGSRFLEIVERCRKFSGHGRKG